MATIAAQAISAAWVLAYFLSGKSHLHLHARNLRLRWSICSKLLAIGSAPFAMQVAASMVSSILNNQLFRYGGNTAFKVISVIMGVWFMCFMPIFGVSQGRTNHRLQLRRRAVRSREEDAANGRPGGKLHRGVGILRDDALSCLRLRAVRP